MKYLIFLLFAANATAQTCNQAVVTQSGTTMNIALAGCGVPVVAPPVVAPPVVVPPVVAPPTDNIPQPSKYAFVNGPTHAGMNGAGPEVNAWSQDPARCNTNPPLNRSWQHNIDLSDYKSKNAFDFFVMGAGESLSYKFTSPAIDASGGFIYNDSATAVVRPTFMSVSTSPCDFPAGKIGTNACYQTGINGNSINWANISGPVPASYCKIQKGAVYYINVRFQDARPFNQGGSPNVDSCVSGNCGGVLQVL